MRVGQDIAVRFPGLYLVHHNIPGKKVDWHDWAQNFDLPLQGNEEQMLSPVMPVYSLPWDIVMYQIQPWKTDGDVLTYAHACPSAEPRFKSNHTSGETGKLSTRSGLPCLASYEQVGSMQMAEAAMFARMPSGRDLTKTKTPLATLSTAA